LRDRLEDLPELVNLFLRRFSREMGRDAKDAAPETLEILAKYRWPGNVRELQSVLKQALLQASGPVLLPSFLPQHIRENPDQAPPREHSDSAKADDWNAFIDERLHADSQNLYTEWFTRMEGQLLVRVLRFTNGNQSRASQILGITRRSLRGKVQAYGIAIEQSVSTTNHENE
jgi:two-component system nitrogen regulation response regulator GlnG